MSRKAVLITLIALGVAVVAVGGVALFGGSTTSTKPYVPKPNSKSATTATTATVGALPKGIEVTVSKDGAVTVKVSGECCDKPADKPKPDVSKPAAAKKPAEKPKPETPKPVAPAPPAEKPAPTPEPEPAPAVAPAVAPPVEEAPLMQQEAVVQEPAQSPTVIVRDSTTPQVVVYEESVPTREIIMRSSRASLISSVYYNSGFYWQYDPMCGSYIVVKDGRYNNYSRFRHSNYHDSGNYWYNPRQTPIGGHGGQYSNTSTNVTDIDVNLNVQQGSRFQSPAPVRQTSSSWRNPGSQVVQHAPQQTVAPIQRVPRQTSVPVQRASVRQQLPTQQVVQQRQVAPAIRQNVQSRQVAPAIRQAVPQRQQVFQGRQSIPQKAPAIQRGSVRQAPVTRQAPEGRSLRQQHREDVRR